MAEGESGTTWLGDGEVAVMQSGGLDGPSSETSTSPRLYLPFVVASIVLGLAAGFASALVLTASRLVNLGIEGSQPQLAEIHGDVQTRGFVGLFVIGMATRLMPFFTRSHLHSVWLLRPVLILVFGALAGRLLIEPWLTGSVLHSLQIALSSAQLLGSAGFLWVVWFTFVHRSHKARRPPWSFVVGAQLLFLVTLIHFGVSLERVDSQAFLTRPAEELVLLGGFTVAFVAGVVSRSFSRRPGQEVIYIAVLATAAAVFVGTYCYLQEIEYRASVVQLADVALISLGLTWAKLASHSGVFDRVASLPGVASMPHLWLVRSAMLWLFVAATLATWFGLTGLLHDELPNLFQVDSIRHSLGLGMATILIVGMGLLLLPEFASKPLNGALQTSLAWFLVAALNIAAALRVGSAVAAPEISYEMRAILQFASGCFAGTGVLVFALSFASSHPALAGR